MGNRRDDVSASAREEAATGDTRMDLGTLLNQMLDEGRREYACMVDNRLFHVMIVDSRNFVVYDRSPFERDTALGA